MDRGLRRTPLTGEHEALDARMGEFAGWWMPISYEGVIAEHRAVREAAGMFDLTHLGKAEVRGPGAEDLLQRVATNDVAAVGVGEAQYNLLLTESGGIIDDLIVYRRGEDDYLVVPNAANTRAVLVILRSEVGPDARVTHLPDVATIAVQGPRSLELVGGFFPEAEGLEFMTCAPGSFGGAAALVARSGYTGERGFEIFLPGSAGPALWRELLAAGRPLGLEPCGLGARDTLRLEMGYPLHGNDISPDHTPLEAGLSWACDFDTEFTGRAALLAIRERGVPARLRGLRMEGRLIPRPGYAVLRDKEPVGRTTSGSFSPTLRVGIAMAYLHPDIELGREVAVDVRGRRGPALVVKPPFVEASPK